MGMMSYKNVFAGQTCVTRGMRNRDASKEKAYEEANRKVLNQNALRLSTVTEPLPRENASVELVPAS
jgi:hypothetical protein